jgi:hypothetical protein
MLGAKLSARSPYRRSAAEIASEPALIPGMSALPPQIRGSQRARIRLEAGRNR